MDIAPHAVCLGPPWLLPPCPQVEMALAAIARSCPAGRRAQHCHRLDLRGEGQVGERSLPSHRKPAQVFRRARLGRGLMGHLEQQREGRDRWPRVCGKRRGDI
jgi:hypothetical protein